MRDAQAWRMLGEAAQRAIDEAQADGQSSACIAVGEITANVRAQKGDARVQVRIDLEATISAAAPSRWEVMEAASQVLVEEFDQAT